MKNVPLINNMPTLLLSQSLWLSLCLCTLQGLAQNIPPKPEPARYVNDYAGLMSASECADLENKLKGYYDSTSTQIVIVTVNDLAGSSIEDYSVKLAETWGIGQKGKDNGLLILAAKTERQTRIETGYGLEALIPDAAARRLIDSRLSPRFKEGKFYQGFDEAVNKAFEYLNGEFKNEPAPYVPTELSDSERRDYWKLTGMVFMLGIIFATALASMLVLGLLQMLMPRNRQLGTRRAKLISHIGLFMAAHLLIMFAFNYYAYAPVILLGDAVAGLLSYLLFETGGSGRGRSYSTGSYSSRSDSGTYSSSSSNTGSGSSSSSSSSSSFGGGSFGGGGASGSW